MSALKLAPRLIDSADGVADRRSTSYRNPQWMGDNKKSEPPVVYEATIDSTIEPWQYQSFEDWCSLGCAISWTVKASSTLRSEGANTYAAAMLDDGLARTAWVEGVEGGGVGEVVRFDLHGFNGTDSVNFSGFYILNGYQKDAVTWRVNGRVATMNLRHNDKPVLAIRLEDSMLFQEVRFESFYVREGDSLVLEITSVYPGERYDDVALSELLPIGAH